MTNSHDAKHGNVIAAIFFADSCFELKFEIFQHLINGWQQMKQRFRAGHGADCHLLTFVPCWGDTV